MKDELSVFGAPPKRIFAASRTRVAKFIAAAIQRQLQYGLAPRFLNG